MLNEEKKALQNYRIETAKEKLETSELLFENGNYKDSVKRAYEAIFNSDK